MHRCGDTRYTQSVRSEANNTAQFGYGSARIGYTVTMHETAYMVWVGIA